jgi:hypothetical protein
MAYDHGIIQPAEIVALYLQYVGFINSTNKYCRAMLVIFESHGEEIKL